MIPIVVIKPLLKYFDSIDKYVTAGLMYKKLHNETTITQNLCSLLDEVHRTHVNAHKSKLTSIRL
ncbi:hypothetical protein NIES4103_54850 [Nostoc sp. NIES-4103]|nr:hypothetical protein NIES4103_54850 [Nostoc sp. NIES-4103]